jgi:hypothetical protein
MLRRMAVLLIGGAALSGGCADLMQRSAVAPDWFNAKAEEFQGKGYPELSEIPTKRGSTEDQPAWETAARSTLAEAAKIEQATASAPPNPTEEEDRAMAAQLRALVDGVPASPPANPGGQ